MNSAASSFKLEPIPPSLGKPDDYPLETHLFKHPCRVVLVGGTGSGKSSMIYSLLKAYQKPSNPYFDAVIILSPTLVYDDAFSSIKNVKLYGPDDEDGEPWQVWLKQWTKDYENVQTERIKKGYRRFRAIIILDDMLTSGVSSKGKPNVIDTVFVKGRNMGLSTMVVTQDYKGLKQNMRIHNLSQLIVHGVNEVDRRKIADEHAGQYLTADQLDALINERHKEKYGYLIIDYHADPRFRFRTTMTDVIDVAK